MPTLLLLLLIVPLATAFVVAFLGPNQGPMIRRLSLASTLVSLVAEPFWSASAWAIQLRRQDSLMPRSFASAATGLSPRRASSTAR